MYVVDRATGEVLSAEPFTRVTTSAGVDTKTGRPREVPGKRPEIGKTVRDICPATSGGKDWQPSAFSPRTGLLYIPENNLCEEMEAVEANYIEGTPFLGANIKMYAGSGEYRGALDAWVPSRVRASGAGKKNFQPEAALLPRQATWSSTGRWTAGSKRWTRAPEI